MHIAAVERHRGVAERNGRRILCEVRPYPTAEAAENERAMDGGATSEASLWLLCVPESGFDRCQLCALTDADHVGSVLPLAYPVRNGLRRLRGPLGTEDVRSASQLDWTVTILFTDIEGFTPLTERLGDRRAQQLLREHNTIVRALVATHGGVRAKSQGDGFMVVFTGARRALRCAIAIQGALSAFSAERPDTPLHVRMGLHTGEATEDAGDFIGRSVIVAARIAAEAHGGEILVSPLVRELTESAGEFTFEEGREVSLKGLSGRYHVFGVRCGDR